MGIKLRRDTAANWTSANPVLEAGQPGYETNTGKLKIGDGSTAWSSLGYFGSAGSGTVTSVALTAPTGFTVTGSPITTSGTLAITTTLSGYVKGNGSGFTAAATIPATDLTGTLAAGQFPALTGDVTTTAGSLATTIGAGTVTLAKMANLAANSIIGNNTGAGATPLALTTAQVKTMLAIGAADVSGLAAIATSGSASDLGAGTVPAARMPAHTGDVTSTAGTVALTVANDAVTFAKMQNSSAASVLVGRGAGAGAGDFQEITLGTNLSMSGTTLNASGGGVTDGDKGDITVATGGTVWTIDAGVVTLAKMADVATSTVFYRKTAGTGAPEVQTLATLKTDLGLTGTNSGDQTITLTGDVTGSGTGSFAATIGNGVVSLAKMANVATGTVFYRKTAGTGAPEVQTLATLKTDLGLTGTNSGDQTITLTGDVTGSGTGSFAATIGAGVVTNAKLANVATATIKGRTTAGTGSPEDLTGTQATALLDTFTSAAKGLAPASGGGTTNFLRADGTWAVPAGGGGGSPGGATTQIQFNDAGVFGGDADFTWDSATNDLVLGGTDTGITLAGVTNEPSAPSAGRLHFYAKSIAGRMVPKVKGPSGLDYGLQASLWQNNIVMWTPTTATAGVWLGTAGAGAGTYTTALPTTTNVYTAMKRGRWANVVTTTNQVLGQRNTEAMFFRGNAAGQGGWFFFARAGFDVWTNGGRFFAGMHGATTVVSNDPSTVANVTGFCVDAADNGAISFLTRDGTAATKAATGITIVSNRGYDLFFWCAPNSSSIGWRIVDFVNGTEASGTATANLPVNTTMLSAGVLASNAALTPVTSIQLGINKIYVETDY